MCQPADSQNCVSQLLSDSASNEIKTNGIWLHHVWNALSYNPVPSWPGLRSQNCLLRLLSLTYRSSKRILFEPTTLSNSMYQPLNQLNYLYTHHTLIVVLCFHGERAQSSLETWHAKSPGQFEMQIANVIGLFTHSGDHAHPPRSTVQQNLHPHTAIDVQQTIWSQHQPFVDCSFQITPNMLQGNLMQPPDGKMYSKSTLACSIICNIRAWVWAWWHWSTLMTLT
jgi:hypothetical protein